MNFSSKHPRRQGHPDLGPGAKGARPRAPLPPPKQRNLFAPSPAESYVPTRPLLDEERWTIAEELDIDGGKDV